MADLAGEDAARNRWLTITALRLAGVAVVVLALLMLNGVIGGPEELAYLLLAIGLVDVFLLPQFLARRWRSPRP